MNAPVCTRRDAVRQFSAISAITLVSGFGFGAGCIQSGASKLQVTARTFGTLSNGRAVQLYTLTNSQGHRVSVMDLGATITEWQVPDKAGKLDSIVIGGDTLEEFTRGVPSASVIGRYANRIRNARFTLDGKTYSVTANSGPHHIHGGREGFASKVWNSRGGSDSRRAWVELTYRSINGEEGYPGNLDVQVRYMLTETNTLEIDYRATTDQPTIVNLTNHAYFNLSGSGSALDHELQILGGHYTPSDSFLIPTGDVASVAGTPLDFTQPHRIGERIQQIQGPSGYDHNYILDTPPGKLRRAARVVDRASGRTLECLTDEPGVQLYTANHFSSLKHPKHGAFCLETQHYPDSPNLPQFPSTVVRPGKAYRSRTHFKAGLI